MSYVCKRGAEIRCEPFVHGLQALGEPLLGAFNDALTLPVVHTLRL